MADTTIEKRKFMWKITNFTREAVEKYDENKRVETEKFEILLGSSNMTEWSFWLYPKDEGDNFGFYIKKVAVDGDNFLIKMSVAIKKTDGVIKNILYSEKASNIIVKGDGWGCLTFLKLAHIFKTENKCLANETLTLIIKLELHQNGPPAKKPRLDLALPECMAKSFNSEDFSDVTIICSDMKSIPIHRFVLGNRSSVFKTMFTTDMAEKKSSKITIAEDSETMMEFMRFIYTQEIQDLKKHASKLLDCAEKYDIPDLKLICVQELIEQLSDENIFENLLLAKLYNQRKLLHKCMEYIDTNFWKLMETEEWEKVDRELMFNILKYVQERTKGIALTNSL